MSVANPARCLICSFSRATLSRVPRRQFHVSLTQCANRTPKHPNIKASDLKNLKPSQFQPYTKEEKTRLAEVYSPEQIAAIEAAESSIDPEDMAKQFSKRDDPWAPHYLDDFSTVEPVVDHHIRAPDSNIDPNWRWKTKHEIIQDLGEFVSRESQVSLEDLGPAIDRILDRHVGAAGSRWATRQELMEDLANFTTGGTQASTNNKALKDIKDEIEREMEDKNKNKETELTIADWERFWDNEPLIVGSGRYGLDAPDATVPDIVQPGETLNTLGEKPPAPRLPDEQDGKPLKEEPTEAFARLMKTTGYSEQEILGLRVKTLVKHGVVNQTRLGKIRKMYVLSIAGNGKGLLGIGEGKSEDPTEALIQSHYKAIRNMQPIPMYEKRTIYGDVRGKVGAVELQLMHRPPGFGLRCQQYIWEMCRAAGIKDLAARVTRSRNPMNTVKATYEALMSQRLPEDIARARGKKLVDVRKVYYAGGV